MARQFTPATFDVPAALQTDQFCFVVLESSLGQRDYEAVMSSKDRLRHIFKPDDRWPRDSITSDANIKDLARHESEFHRGEAFAYAVLSPCQSRYIGCVYIEPTSAAGFGCEVYLWVRDSELELDDDLVTATRRWLSDQWPFRQSAFPGRDINWSDWAELRGQ